MYAIAITFMPTSATCAANTPGCIGIGTNSTAMRDTAVEAISPATLTLSATIAGFSDATPGICEAIAAICTSAPVTESTARPAAALARPARPPIAFETGRLFIQLFVMAENALLVERYPTLRSEVSGDTPACSHAVVKSDHARMALLQPCHGARKRVA
jgi:hypothetical protein